MNKFLVSNSFFFFLYIYSFFYHLFYPSYLSIFLFIKCVEDILFQNSFCFQCPKFMCISLK